MKFLDRVKQFFKGNAAQPQLDARLDIYDIQGFIPARTAQPPAQPNAPSKVGAANEYDSLPDVNSEYDRLPDVNNEYDKLPDSPIDANQERYVGSQFLERANEAMRQEALRGQARPAQTYVGSQFLKEANEAMRAQEAAPQRERRGTFGQELKLPDAAPEQKAEEIKPEPSARRRGTFGQPSDTVLRPHRNEIASSILEQNGSHQTPQDRPDHQLGAKLRPSLTHSAHSNQ